MKYFWEGSSVPFAEQRGVVTYYFGAPSRTHYEKALTGARIVNENGVLCSWDDVVRMPDAHENKGRNQ